jgi:hypothetical protein
VANPSRRRRAVPDNVDVYARLEEARAAGASDRKLRLFACACARQAWQLMTDPRSRSAVEVAERYADGEASAEELTDAGRAGLNAVMDDLNDNRRHASTAAGRAALAAYYATRVLVQTRRAVRAVAGEQVRRRQAALLTCVVGPRSPPAIERAWLAWGDGTVVKIAAAIYEARDFGRVPLLADALEDAGGTDEEILGHLRRPGVHCRGCWAVDLLLGKK